MEKNVFEDFGMLIFDGEIMKSRLSKDTYIKYLECKKSATQLDKQSADEIASAMKTWAIEHGCTHYTHWFHPLTGLTAEKHEAFIDKDSKGNAIIKFNGKTLIKGEPDASSFPSGGLRSTFEARGYTYWDVTSPAFIRDNVLCIPSVFVSYYGESLDKKGPLLKSIAFVNEKCTKLLNMLGHEDVTEVKPNVGLEQEYFLIDRAQYKKRLDLMLTGRTLFGDSAPKGQEFEDHYFGSIPSRVHAFMHDVDKELWKLGIYAKTEHNEVAPRQFELAPLFAEANVAVDQNQVIMDVLKRMAYKNGFACLLHEKPFGGVNGSGKHNNYSLCANTGLNVFDPKTDVFPVFTACLIKAVDTYPELLRISASNPGNDFRLGCNEAPPAIISIFLGDAIENIIDEYAGISTKETGRVSKIEGFGYVGSDNTDRNRTSPVAFTGNKFEFRMLGSSASGAMPNVVLDTIIGDEVASVIAMLEKTAKEDYEKVLKAYVKDVMENHGRVVYGKNGYSQEWIEEAARRGLPNITSSIEAVAHFDSEKNVALLTKSGIYTEKEIEARKTVMAEQYISSIMLEAKTMLSLVDGYVVPNMVKEIENYSKAAAYSKYAKEKLEKVSSLLDELGTAFTKLKTEAFATKEYASELEKGLDIKARIVPLLASLREVVDSYEKIASDIDYPLPTYKEMLY
ncbi:MAG: glutamine synthetase III [Bacilli bacterium]|nr:glutamine synthetase III [Bacilli bacterium]